MNDDELLELLKKFDLEPSYLFDSSYHAPGRDPDYLSMAYKMIRVPRKTLHEESIVEAIETCIELTFKIATAILHEAVAQNRMTPNSKET